MLHTKSGILKFLNCSYLGTSNKTEDTNNHDGFNMISIVDSFRSVTTFFFLNKKKMVLFWKGYESFYQIVLFLYQLRIIQTHRVRSDCANTHASLSHCNSKCHKASLYVSWPSWVIKRDKHSDELKQNIIIWFRKVILIQHGIKWKLFSLSLFKFFKSIIKLT